MTQAPVRPAAPAVGTGAPHDGVPRARPSGDRADVAGTGAHRADAARPPARDARRWPWAVALALYSCAVGLVVAWPSPVDAHAQDSIGAFFRRLHAAGAPDWVGYTLLESGANVAMFVPLGFMVTRLSRRWWWGLLAPVALSACAELGQALLRPERFATAADVAANGAGAAVGMLVALVVMGRGRPASTRGSTRPGRSRHRAG